MHCRWEGLGVQVGGFWKGKEQWGVQIACWLRGPPVQRVAF